MGVQRGEGKNARDMGKVKEKDKDKAKIYMKRNSKQNKPVE